MIKIVLWFFLVF